MTEFTDDNAYDLITELSQTLINAFEMAGDLPTTGSDYNLGQRVAYIECVRLVRQHSSTYLLAGKPEKLAVSFAHYLHNGLTVPKQGATR